MSEEAQACSAKPAQPHSSMPPVIFSICADNVSASLARRLASFSHDRQRWRPLKPLVFPHPPLKTLSTRHREVVNNRETVPWP
jgi:hypothetical protein